MPYPVVLTLPIDNQVKDEVKRELSPYAVIRDTPPTYGLSEIKLIVEVIAGSTTIIANGAAIMTFLIMLRDRYKQAGKESGIHVGEIRGKQVALENVDEELLRQLLGLSDENT